MAKKKVQLGVIFIFWVHLVPCFAISDRGTFSIFLANFPNFGLSARFLFYARPPDSRFLRAVLGRGLAIGFTVEKGF